MEIEIIIKPKEVELTSDGKWQPPQIKIKIEDDKVTIEKSEK